MSPEWEDSAEVTDGDTPDTSDGSDSGGGSLLSTFSFDKKRLIEPQVSEVSIEGIQENENIPVTGRAEAHAVRAVFHLSGMAFGEDGNAVFDSGMAVIYKLLEQRNNG
jgi:hypothetical protein